MSVVCPVCAKDESMQKVSGLVLSGQSSGTFTGAGYAVFDGTVTQNIVRILSAPDEPKEPSRSDITAAWIFMVLGLMWFALFAILLIGRIVEGEKPPINDYVLTLGIGGIGPLMGLLSLYGSNSRYEAKRSKYEAEKPVWDATMERWRRLYYCFRDDIVFDPDTGEFSQPSDVRRLLFVSSPGKPN